MSVKFNQKMEITEKNIIEIVCNLITRYVEKSRRVSGLKEEEITRILKFVEDAGLVVKKELPPREEKVQCSATTLKGERCKLNAKDGMDMCNRHASTVGKLAMKKTKCIAILKAGPNIGKPCDKNSAKNSEYCSVHAKKKREEENKKNEIYEIKKKEKEREKGKHVMQENTPAPDFDYDEGEIVL